MISLRGWLVISGLLILLGSVEWLYAPAPTPPKSLRKMDEPWLLPQTPKPQPAKAMEILARKSLWGRLPEAEVAKPLNDPEWRFVGFVANGPERFLLIKIDGQPEQRLTVNDKLPGGSKILAIENDRVCLLVNGKKRSLGITKVSQRAL